jgi:hypothetical protein
MAEAFTRVKPTPKRSILFLAVTAEEKGLLGAKHHAAHPLYPLQSTLANINMDGLNVLGRTRDLGWSASANPPWKIRCARLFRRKAAFCFRKQNRKKDISSAQTTLNSPIKECRTLHGRRHRFHRKPKDFGKQKRRRAYIDRDYHKVSDEIKPTGIFPAP